MFDTKIKYMHGMHSNSIIKRLQFLKGLNMTQKSNNIHTIFNNNFNMTVPFFVFKTVSQTPLIPFQKHLFLKNVKKSEKIKKM